MHCRGEVGGAAAWTTTATLLTWVGVGSDHPFLAVVGGFVGGVQVWRWNRRHP